MEWYNLDSDTLKEHLNDLCFSLNKKNPFNMVPSKIRGKLTKAYNKLNKGSIVRKRKKFKAKS